MRRLGVIVTTLLAALMVAAVTSGAAQAATMVLYCNWWTSWNEIVSSGRANDVVSGGRANVVATGNVRANIRTHNSAGSVVFRAQGSHATVSLVHRQVRSARSSCFWSYVPRIPGETQMYCHWRRA